MVLQGLFSPCNLKISNHTFTKFVAILIQLVGSKVNFVDWFILSNQIMSKFYVFKLISHFDC